MLNRVLLIGYAVIFIGLVNTYDSYQGNILLVVLAATAITAGGLAAWLISIRGRNKDDSEEL